MKFNAQHAKILLIFVPLVQILITLGKQQVTSVNVYQNSTIIVNQIVPPVRLPALHVKAPPLVKPVLIPQETKPPIVNVKQEYTVPL